MAVRFIQSNELLSLADHLAGRDAGRGKPRTAYLRRSISTAYYAIFHLLTQHAVQRLLGDDGWTQKHAAVARWVAHTDLATLADATNGRGSRALVEAMSPVEPRLANLSQDFIDLQAARHRADYDDYFDASKASTLAYVDAAKRAVGIAGDLYRIQEPSYLRFLGLALGGVKVAKNR
ncbi:MAG: hypothetical protein ACFCVF_11555 [Kineosporiaceae bacterium]